jgi:ABC-type Fe3+/spermidine/putrescine transport system ATPase subunit
MDKLNVQNLVKDFGGKRVLKGISFDVRAREFLSILGPSGCGKTTILRILIGLTAPNSGAVYRDGQDITNLPPAERKMGIVFQNYALFENMTVLKNVEYALSINKEKRAAARETAEHLIELVGIKEYMHAKPISLSGGQQQRVAIARTLATNPDIVLLDEPMSALDADIRLALRDELKKIQKHFGSTMIYITHDQEEALAMSDRVMVMNEGEIMQLDTPHNIVERPVNDFVKSFVADNVNIKINSLIGFAGNRK